ncbi:MAG: hypothetical protein KAT35_06230, partial [Candidatus Aenigmarchaeota archaeon]|nr:hypothetical protein [Candidatus Aenigmarchaeota archaeon]
QTVKENDYNIDYLVLANMENESSLLAGRVAGLRQGYIVPVRLSGISYQGLPPQVNTDNGAKTALQALINATGMLYEQGLFSGSPEFSKGEPLYLGIVGGSMSIPYIIMHDPGLEAFNDKDGPLIYTDLFYSDLNQDGYFDVSVGRFPGSLTSTSLQLERMGLPKQEDAVLIGQYRHRKYLDLQLMGGGMMQAYTAQAALDEAGFQTRRIIENRSQPLIDLFPEGIGFKQVYDIIVHRYNLNKLAGTSGFVSVVSWVWLIAEGGEIALYSMLEHDWEKWLNDLKTGSVGFPDRLEVLYTDTDLGQPRILGYFGMGDRYWLIPPDKKNDADLIALPYLHSEPMETLNFSNFLFDDHDMSAGS